MEGIGYEIVEPPALERWLPLVHNRELMVALLTWLCHRLHQALRADHPTLHIDVITVSYLGAYPALGIRHDHSLPCSLPDDMSRQVEALTRTILLNSSAYEFLEFAFDGNEDWEAHWTALLDRANYDPEGDHVNEFVLKLPRDKHDAESAEALVAAGWERNMHLAPQMLEWLQDMNWPIAWIFQPFLASVGLPLAPLIKAVIASDDDIWKHNLLVQVVAHSKDLSRALRADLERLAGNPTAGERSEEVPREAQAILDKFA